MRMDVTIYTIPGCHRCNVLKEFLKTQSVQFKEKTFGTEAQVELIMMNVFSDPPVLEINGEILTPNKMFDGDEKLREDVVLRFLNSTQEVTE